MRRHTDFSGYTRSLHMLRKDPDRSYADTNALAAFAANEAQFIFLFLKLAGVVDDPVRGNRWGRGLKWEVPSADSRDIRKALEVML